MMLKVPRKLAIHHTSAVILIVFQAGLIDYYLIHNNHDSGYYAWILADLIVFTVSAVTFFLGHQYLQRYLDSDEAQRRSINQQGLLRNLGILPYTWFSWLIYSVVLAGKIIAIFKTFGSELDEHEKTGTKINLLEFTFCAAAAIFMLSVSGVEQMATHAQRHYLRWMQHYVLLEILDCLEFLSLLFTALEIAVDEHDGLPHGIHDVILAFACINLIAPAHALYRLSSIHNREAETKNRFFLTQTLVGTFLGNIPYFGIRVYLWDQHYFITGLFVMKNMIGIAQDISEVAENLHLFTCFTGGVGSASGGERDAMRETEASLESGIDIIDPGTSQMDSVPNAIPPLVEGDTTRDSADSTNSEAKTSLQGTLSPNIQFRSPDVFVVPSLREH